MPWDPESAPVVAWIERAVAPGARVVRIEAMPASSTARHRIDVALADGSARRFVLRRYHDAARRARDPWYVPAHEALALRLLADSAVPAPQLLATDLEASVCDAPALLESWVAGEPAWAPVDLEGYLARAAEALVSVHGLCVPPGTGLPRYATYRSGDGLEREPLLSPPHSTRPGLWERVGEALARPRPVHREAFIHRDYHPGNVLWDGTRVPGVVDWATAAWGPPGIDLARMRLNLAAHHGKEVANQFVAAYVAAGGDPSARHPYWDLLDAADLLPDLVPPGRRGGRNLAWFEEYVESVLAEDRGR